MRTYPKLGTTFYDVLKELCHHHIHDVILLSGSVQLHHIVARLQEAVVGPHSEQACEAIGYLAHNYYCLKTSGSFHRFDYLLCARLIFMVLPILPTSTTYKS